MVLELQQADRQILRREYENSCPTDINDFWGVKNCPDPFGSVEDEVRGQTVECRVSLCTLSKEHIKSVQNKKLLKRHVLLRIYDASFTTQKYKYEKSTILCSITKFASAWLE
jgi:hypothetical protein